MFTSILVLVSLVLLSLGDRASGEDDCVEHPCLALFRGCGDDCGGCHISLTPGVRYCGHILRASAAEEEKIVPISFGGDAGYPTGEGKLLFHLGVVLDDNKDKED